MSQTNTDTTIPSMLPNTPPQTEPLYVVRLKLKLRETLDQNRRLQRELSLARQELNSARLRLRKRT